MPDPRRTAMLQQLAIPAPEPSAFDTFLDMIGLGSKRGLPAGTLDELERRARPLRPKVPAPERPPQANPLSMLNTGAAASSLAVGHLSFSKPGDALGAIREG